MVHVLEAPTNIDDEGPSEEENIVPPSVPSPDAASSSNSLDARPHPPPRVGQPTFTREQLAAQAAEMG